MSDNEESLIGSYAVVYVLRDAAWIVCGKGWTEIHLFKDLTDNSFRIVGWSMEDQDIVLNVVVNGTSSYTEKTSDFHKYNDGINTYGFGFFKENLIEAKDFKIAVLKAISDSNKANMAPPQKYATFSAAAISSYVPHGQPLKQKNATVSSPTNEHTSKPSIGQIFTDTVNQNNAAKEPVTRKFGLSFSSIAAGQAGKVKSLSNNLEQQLGKAYNKNALNTANAMLAIHEQKNSANLSDSSAVSAVNNKDNEKLLPKKATEASSVPAPPKHPKDNKSAQQAVEKAPKHFENNNLASSAIPPPPKLNKVVQQEVDKAPKHFENSNVNSSFIPPPPKQPKDEKKLPPPLPNDFKIVHKEKPKDSKAATCETNFSVPPPPPKEPKDNRKSEYIRPSENFIPPPPLRSKSNTMPDLADKNIPDASWGNSPRPSPPCSPGKEPKNPDGFHILLHNKKNSLTHAPMGKLKILPAKPLKLVAAGNENASVITDAYGIVHTQHVSYDPETGAYCGIPDDWEAKICVQFGLMPHRVETASLPEYRGRIPRILIFLKDEMIKYNGLNTVGIFRLAPDAEECAFTKKEINSGRWLTHRRQEHPDPNVFANLLKVWFRELPESLLNSVPQAQITNCTTESEAGNILKNMEEPCCSLLLWLFDLCILVASYSEVNKMSFQNLSIVFAPNLFNTNSIPDPLAAIQFSQKVCQFLHKGILYRQQQRRNLL